ncbi:MAG: hypothetical protein LBG74_07990 [Spirochaetaceae bacterium]|jgi:hypothetical protein|nr:hypothetical protein [Spirochaetaceae bacterium]
MEQVAVKDEKAYRQLLGAFKKQSNGLTVADVVARTALPVEKVKELLPIAADEYSARLRVTGSGEILYTFPRVLKSKYKGWGVTARRLWSAVRSGFVKVAVTLFKVWIMVMLVGYFVLFMLIALAAMLLSVAASSQNNSRSRDSGGGIMLFSGVLDLIIRIWFYSELTRSINDRYDYGYGRRRAPSQKKPLYKAIFSFVFGDGDPNADSETREKQAFVAYVQANDGVISLPEFMTLTGLPPLEADEKILAYCSQFSGSPEPTEDGTVVYVFKQLLLRADTRDNSFKGFSAPLKRIRPFSSNEKKMNIWFGIINTVNLLFGGYFLYGALHTGIPALAGNTVHGLYDITFVMARHFLSIQNPLPAITWGLGAVPLAFSVFFWIIPALRSLWVKKENERVKIQNLRKTGYQTILDKRLEVRSQDIHTQIKECRPAHFENACENIIKEIGGYSVPSVSVGPMGETVYAFNALDDEIRALQKFRIAESKKTTELGGIIFDSGA